METEFFKKVMTSHDGYWVVSKKKEGREYGDWVRKNDTIVFIAIPEKWKRGLKPNEILLIDVENYQREFIDCNIYLNEAYPPFQQGQSLSDVTDGFPVKTELGINEFIAQAIQLESDNLFDYKKLMDRILESKEEQSNQIQ